jgi:4-amino-4-deoxy-L-arabinose transferase-like glycosyltransferase
MRVFLTIILPLELPTALYVLWAVSAGRVDMAAAAPWRELPWTWLGAIGVVLVVAVLAYAVEFGGTKEGTYVPPHLENGHVVPGHVAPAPRG